MQLTHAAQTQVRAWLLHHSDALSDALNDALSDSLRDAGQVNTDAQQSCRCFAPHNLSDPCCGERDFLGTRYETEIESMTHDTSTMPGNHPTIRHTGPPRSRISTTVADSSPAEPDHNPSLMPRRRLLSALATSSVALPLIPNRWSKPVVDIVLLPAHGQTTPSQPVAPVTPAGPGTAMFNMAGAHSFEVPAGVTQLRVVVHGAGGGGTSRGTTAPGANGGDGGTASGTLDVTGIATLQLFVGRGGGGSASTAAAGSGGTGDGDGGDGGNGQDGGTPTSSAFGGGGGGGASTVAADGTILLRAGGGGGAGGLDAQALSQPGSGGVGGGVTGGGGGDGSFPGGAGATAGGSGGEGGQTGLAGDPGQPGTAGGGGGGGGGTSEGANSGSGGGGGGGSGFAAASVSDPVLTSGTGGAGGGTDAPNGADGEIIISWG